MMMWSRQLVALVLLTELNACIPTAAVNLNLPRPEPARRVSALGPDPLRVNRPKVPFALEPLQWGTVSPRGWLLEWATALSHGSGSPKCSAFATTKPDGHSVDGWRGGRPSFGGFWDEDSAYYIDGLTRLGLVLQDDILLSRVKEDYEWVMAHPDNFNATYRGDIVEGWIRSIYSRGMLAYYDGTGDKRVLSFLNEQLGKYDPRTSTYASDQTRQGSRSMTQMEALLETYAYGGDVKLVETALQLMSPIAKNDGYRFMQELLAPGCVALEPAAINATSGVADEGGCVNHAHGVTYNEVSKLFAMGYSYSANRSHLQASLTAYELVDKFDMQVYGVNSGDEDMNGIGPNAATETCDVSDFIYSNSWMLRVTGRSKFGDHLERAFYNAAPGAVNRSFSGHVYFQAPNLIPSAPFVANAEQTKFEEAHIHMPPCCTGNQVRILPNFIHHMWFAALNGSGLAATTYGPNVVKATVGVGSARTGVQIEVTTDYPFGTQLRFNITSSAETVSSSGAGEWRKEQATFPLLLRIPEWTTINAMRVTIGGATHKLVPDESLPGFGRLDIQGIPCVVELQLEMNVMAKQGRTVWNGPQLHGPDAHNGHGGDERHGEDDMHAHAHARAHTEDAGRVGLGAGWTTVVPDLPFCTVNRGPLLFALPLETGSVHGSTPREVIVPRASAPTPLCNLQPSLGCFKESEERQLTFKAYQGTALTRDKCALACAYWCSDNPPHNHNCLAGVEGKEGNQCYCGHHIGQPGTRLEPASSHCDVPCSGDQNVTCGGDWAVDIFNITCAHPLPPDPFAPPPTPPVPSPPSPPVRDWRYALHCDSASMQAHLRPLKTPFDWPLDSALTITAQATVFNNWSSIWDLPPQPFGVEDVQLRGEATVPLTLVPYGSAKVYKLSMWPLVLNTSSGH